MEAINLFHQFWKAEWEDSNVIRNAKEWDELRNKVYRRDNVDNTEQREEDIQGFGFVLALNPKPYHTEETGDFPYFLSVFVGLFYQV